MARRIRLTRALVRRLIAFAATFAGVITLLLVMLWAAPGDPIDLLPNADEVRPVLEVQWHLNDPLPVRIARYLWAALHGDLGTSVAYRTGAPVTDIIVGPGLRSLFWVIGSLSLTMAWGTALALWSPPHAVRRGVQLVSITPVFLLALLSGSRIPPAV